MDSRHARDGGGIVQAGITYIGCAAKASDIVTGHVSGLGVVDLTFPRFDKIMQSTSEKVLELKNVARATALGKSPVIIGILEHVAGHKSPKVVATSIAKTGNQKLEKETRTKEQIAILQIIYQYSRAFFDNQKKQKDYLGCGLGTACIGIRFISIYNLRQKKYICAISKFDRRNFPTFPGLLPLV